MKLRDDLLKKLARTYEPQAMVTLKYKGKDVAFKTNAAGHPVLLFIGRRATDGNITGERYVRTLIFDAAGKAIKDHWELKGRAG